MTTRTPPTVGNRFDVETFLKGHDRAYLSGLIDVLDRVLAEGSHMEHFHAVVRHLKARGLCTNKQLGGYGNVHQSMACRWVGEGLFPGGADTAQTCLAKLRESLLAKVGRD